MTRPLSHSLLLALGVLALAGCDLTATEAPGLAESLDGSWTLAVTSDEIDADGSVSPRPDGPTYAADAAPALECNRTTIEAAGDEARVLRLDADPGPTGGVTCFVIAFDRDGRRVIFVGQGELGTDVAWTVDEGSSSRHVWSAYAPQDGLASTIRTRWTFRRG